MKKDTFAIIAGGVIVLMGACFCNGNSSPDVIQKKGAKKEPKEEPKEEPKNGSFFVA